MEKRNSERVNKRLEVKYRTKADNTAITSDLSDTGMFISTSRGGKQGSVLDIMLNLPNSPQLYLKGKVLRSISAAPGLNGNVKNGMGINLISPPQDYLNYVQSLLTVRSGK